MRDAATARARRPFDKLRGRLSRQLAGCRRYKIGVVGAPLRPGDREEEIERLRSPLFGDFVVAGFAAGAAVVEAVLPEADIELSLAEGAVLIARAAFFNLFALSATGFGLGGHTETLAPRGRAGNIPLVTVNWLRALGSGFQLRLLGFSGAYHWRQA